jgi:hypothetical protein
MNYIKFINAQRAKNIHRYKHTKENLYKTDVSIWLNKMCTGHDDTSYIVSLPVSQSIYICNWLMRFLPEDDS